MHISLAFASPSTINTASLSSFYTRGLILQFIVTYPVVFLFFQHKFLCTSACNFITVLLLGFLCAEITGVMICMLVMFLQII